MENPIVAEVTSTTDLPEVLYTPDSSLRNPRRLLSEMWRDLRASRELAWRLTIRDISAQYRQSFLGVFWAFLGPLTTTVTFSFLNSQRIITVGDTGMPYPAYVMIGSIMWTVFSEALNTTLSHVQGASGMLSRISFPREALILSAMGKVLFNFAIKFVMLIVILLIYHVPLYWTAVLIPIPVLGLLMFGTLLGLLVVPFATLIGDVSRVMAMVTSLWFFLTPVIYPPQVSGLLGTLSSWNPVTPLLITAKEALTMGQFTYLPAFGVVFTFILFFLLAGLILYRVAMPILIERMGA